LNNLGALVNCLSTAWCYNS